jgi:hypothetical protein
VLGLEWLDCVAGIALSLADAIGGLFVDCAAVGRWIEEEVAVAKGGGCGDMCCVLVSIYISMGL